jgi:UDP-GlcNAc:undecaprenyl-phosphate GlcNAc-1-phosphate transferase
VGLLVVSLALSGALLGFLFYNFPPASIFMGDSGSLFLGFTLASLAIARQPQASNVLAVIGVPVLLFLLPILDTILVTVTRLLRGQSPARGGRDHTSHRLVAFGLNERQTVLALYLVALAAGLAGLAIERVDYWLSLVFVPVVIIILALATAYLGGMKLVLSSDTRPRATALNRLMLDLTYRRRVLEVLLDFLLISLAYYLAFLVYYRARLDSPTLLLFLQSLPIAVGSAFLSFYIFGIYRGVWRYVGLDDILGFIKAALGTLVIVTPAVWLIHSRSEYPLAIFLIFASLLFVELAASRSSFRLLDRLSAQRTRQAEQRVLICGAGDAGELALRWILMNPQLAYRPVGFLDQDTYKIGRHIHGVPVLGPPDEIATVLQENAVDGVILTSEYLNDQEEARQQILTCIHQRGGWARTLRLEFELLE